MKGKVYLVVAQILGVFPVKGLWGADSVMDYRKLSWPYVYGFFTLLLRLLVMLLQATLVVSWVNNKVYSSTDRSTVCIGFACTFCSGAIYQILIFHRTKTFIIFLKKIEEYEMAYPRKNKFKMCSRFLSCNVIFTIYTISFPLAMIGYYIIQPLVRGQDRIMTSIDRRLDSIFGPGYPVIIMLIYGLVTVFMEVASLFPILQLAYAVNSLESKLKDIYHSIVDHTDPKSRSEIELLLETYTNGTWAEKMSLANKVGLLKSKSNREASPVQDSLFWKRICDRYLDFIELHQSFLTFSAPYFVGIYPTQILSTICILYINTTDWLDDAAFAKSSLNTISCGGFVRIWAMSSIWQEAEEIRKQILLRALRFDVDSILHVDERVQYEKFVKMVKWMCIQLNVGGIFNINRGNLPAILMAAISNLIVLIQFKSAETSTSCASSAYNTTS